MVTRARFGLLLTLLVGCTTGTGHHTLAEANGSRDNPVCVDRDYDGFGEACTAGADCDDHDPLIHTGCLRCATPAEGCTCAEGTAPDQCFLDPSEGSDGALMCHEGTRYCRDGKWSGCESVMTYSALKEMTTGLISSDGGLVRCNDCNVLCYRITDNLEPVDGGLMDAGSQVTTVDGGGLTLAQLPSDAGTDAGPTSTVTSDAGCTPGVGPDLDCDGIPNNLDPYPNQTPFATANPSIFLQIGPGQTGTGQIDLNFYLNSADVYFMVDQTGSMAEERDQLKASLTTGDFINSASYNCADYDFDHLPNNELKTQGIIGAIKCKIRDANFGTGFFREIPFSGYADNDHVAFGNYQDITGNVPNVLAAVNRLTTIGNNDWPEASMVSLHNLLTGSGMYFGTGRSGIPPRNSCPSSTWGYPCFRSSAVPIVVMFTDAQFHNGPSNNTYAYSNSFSVTAGTGDAYTPVVNTNETFNGAAVLGDLTSSYKTFTGDTRLMASDLSSALVGPTCISSSAGADAVFRFNLTAQKAVTIESTGSQFDTVLGLFTGVPGTPTNLTASTNTNETGASALTLGQAHDAYNSITGNTTAMAADYQWSNVGCDASTSSPDAVFKFDVSSTTQVALDTSGSSFDTVVGLYAAAPALPPSYTAILNTNDDYLTPYPVLDVYNKVVAFSGSTALLNADYSQAQLGCTGVDSAAKDATYSFSLSMPTRLRISTEGSSFDTVLALYDNLANPVVSAAVTGNELQTNAYNAGTLDGRILQLTGTTIGMGADYAGTQIGCTASDSAPDAMFKFHLDTPRDVQIDTIGTTLWDPVIGLITNTNIDPKTYLPIGTNNNETIATAKNLGTINGKDLVVTGASTSGMTADYDLATVTCQPQGLAAEASPDAVYKFHLDTDTRVQINTDNTTVFDSVLSLRAERPAEPSTALATNNNDTVATTFDVGEVYHKSFVKTGTTAAVGLNHNYNPTGCNANASAKDVVYTFTLGTATTVQLDTIGTANPYDTVLALYPHTLVDTTPAQPTAVQATSPPAASVANGNELPTNAHPVGMMDNQWKRYTGNTTSMATSTTTIPAGCGANSGSRDAFFKFSLMTPRTINITDVGTTAFDAALQLFRCTDAMLTCSTVVAVGPPQECAWVNGNNSPSQTESITANLAAGTYVVGIKGHTSSDRGTYTLSIQDNALVGNQITCDDDSGNGSTTSLITRSLAAGTYDVVVSASANTTGAYALRFRDKTWWDAFGAPPNYAEVQCDTDSGASNAAMIERDLAAGDYYAIVKGSTWWLSKGAYSFRIKDVSHPPVGATSDMCDNDSGGGLNSKMVLPALAAGDYWVGLKGRGMTNSGIYKLNIKDTSATASGTALQCDDNSGDSPQSMIERDMQAGNYQVLVKGKTAAANGAYKISFRDVTNKGIAQIACANDGGAGTASYLEQSLNAGTYYAVVKGNNPTDKGAFALSIRDVTSRPVTSTSCDDNSSTYNTSKITKTLNAGTYYVALKGKTGTELGPYQLSIGAGATHTGSYTPATWYDTLTAIQNTKARVISILSCQNDPSHGNASGDCNSTRTQANALADASGALGANLQKLVFDINDNGSGLSSSVVSAVSQLAAYLEMNVSVRVIFEPNLNPGFVVTVKAIDQLTDGCDGLIGITHQKCRPGATPRFQILFANPLAPNNVPVNPADPKGGYNFRAELIGDNQFVVDSIPIYIIPQPAAAMGPPPPQYYPTGEYHQDVQSPGCNGNQRPDWRDLDWTADVYGNTSVTFKACAAQTQAALASCVPKAIAKVTGGGACTSNANCTVGYCNTGIGVCQIATAGACMTGTDCPANSYCDSTAHLCTFQSQPVYIGTALGSLNFNSYLRMSIALDATQPFVKPPVLHRWEMTYICNQVL